MQKVVIMQSLTEMFIPVIISLEESGIVPIVRDCLFYKVASCVVLTIWKSLQTKERF